MEKEQNVVIEQKSAHDESNDQKAQDAIINGNIEVIKKLRVRISGLVHITKNAGNESFEKMNAVSNLYMLKGWLGDVLEYLGEDGINNTVNIHTFKDIQEEEDLSEGIKVQVKTVKDGKESMRDGNDIESVNHVKRDMDYIANQVSQLATVTDTAYETFIFQHVRETKFWLDRELFRIKEVAKQKIFSKTSQGEKKLPRRPQGQKPIFSNLKRADAGEGNVGNPPVMKVHKDESGIDEKLNKEENGEQAEGKANS